MEKPKNYILAEMNRTREKTLNPAYQLSGGSGFVLRAASIRHIAFSLKEKGVEISGPEQIASIKKKSPVPGGDPEISLYPVTERDIMELVDEYGAF